MSLGIAFKGPEGLVLAADSRVTLAAQIFSGGQQTSIHSTYDNATKLLKVAGQDFVGVVTYGIGAIGLQTPRTAQSFLPEFEAELAGSGASRLSVDAFANRLSSFFVRQWNSLMPQGVAAGDMEFLVGGYDAEQPYGRVFEFKIPSGPTPTENMVNDFGLTFGGQTEIVTRLLQGFDQRVMSIAQGTLLLDDGQRDRLAIDLRRKLGIPIPFQFLPLQDCVDLSIFLIRTTIGIQSLSVGLRGVGGAIDVATITRMHGFRAVQQKAISGESHNFLP